MKTLIFCKISIASLTVASQGNHGWALLPPHWVPHPFGTTLALANPLAAPLLFQCMVSAVQAALLGKKPQVWTDRQKDWGRWRGTAPILQDEQERAAPL